MLDSITPERPGSTIHTRAALLFLLAVAVTIVSVWLNLLIPQVLGTGLQQSIIRVAIQVLILVGLWRGLARTDLDRRSRLTVTLAISLPLTAWLALVWWLALNGAFQPGSGLPALIPAAVVLPLLIWLPPLLLSRKIGALLDAMPPGWLIGLQVYRIAGSIFLVGWAAGTIPAIFGLPAGLGDTLVGVLALPVALYVQSGARGGRMAGVLWNVLGILDLVNAVLIGALSTPGPSQLIVTSVRAPIGTYPLVMIPAFAVPSSILLHALSLRQLRRLARRPAAPPRTSASGELSPSPAVA